ncbi:hypothetical protein [Burkholderia cenocepacia]|uniref:hypothetical protein n=1 Tax=Burkholderia cenocepacia TaxID=95486 RepID=UPI001B93E498|nr:hypothetical protein [Burkholderia cenocepacia]MBR8409799.1 hypothetical protein [Burkholderia cenocepacia]
MNEIKHTPGPWTVSIHDHIAGAARGTQSAWVRSPDGCIGHIETSVENAHLISAAPDMALALELIAADADAGNSRLTSGIRMALDAALIKAGRKAAPEPVRHFRVCGEGL